MRVPNDAETFSLQVLPGWPKARPRLTVKDRELLQRADTFGRGANLGPGLIARILNTLEDGEAERESLMFAGSAERSESPNTGPEHLAVMGAVAFLLDEIKGQNIAPSTGAVERLRDAFDLWCRS